MSQQQVPFDQMFLAEDLQRAEYLKERVRLASEEMQVELKAHNFLYVKAWARNIDAMIGEMIDLSNKRANHERGFREGVMKSKEIGELVNLLATSGVVFIAPAGGKQHDTQ